MSLRDAVKQFGHLIAPIKSSVQLMISRGVLTLINDALATQEVQLNMLAGENLGGVERFQEYGFTSVPFPGAEAIFASVAGNRTKGVVLVVGDKRYRLTGMQGGEVALHDDQGQTIIIHRDRIEVTAPTINFIASSQINITTPLVMLNGKMVSSGDVVANNISLDQHTHKGVQPGSGNIGGPQ
jgi:phage baseplate assembly protein V